MVSPLAVSKRTLKPGHPRTLPVGGVVVCSSGPGPVRNSKRTRRPAIVEALDVYYHQPEDTHYVIDHDGTIHAVVPENRVSWHAGWGRAGRRRWASWTAPKWWSDVWGRWNAKTPADLLPNGAVDPNQVYIGVELLGNEPPRFTPAQYDALARLVVDIARRHRVTIPSAPSPRLLGHEDVEPTSLRSNRFGGWDPGAHRNPGIKPVFSWSELWSRMQAIGGTSGRPSGGPTGELTAGASRAPAGDAARPFLKATNNRQRYRLLAAMLDQHRGDIPLDFLLGWIATESGGFIDVTTSEKENGFFQIMPSESRMLKLDHVRLSTDPEYSVRSGIQLVRFYVNVVRTRYPWFPPGTELFWRMVDFQHAMGMGAAASLLSSMRKNNVPMTWEAIKQHEVTYGPRLGQPVLIPRNSSQVGRFGRNVDKVFREGRRIAASLGR